MQAKARAAFDAMKALNIVKVVAEFQGGNDEGGYDDYTCYDANDTALDVDINFYRYGRNGHPADPIADWLEDVLDGEYGGFGGSFDVSGNVTLDAATQKTTMSSSMTDWVDQPDREF